MESTNKKFTFEYSKDEDFFSSEENIFRRMYAVSDETKASDSSRKIVLENSEIIKIGDAIEKYSILNLPAEFSCDFIPPKDANFINLKINFSESKEIHFKFDRMNPNINCSKGKRLMKFTKILDSIIYNKKEVKDLPPTNLFYE